jgi:endogenous inhibitor of DNA gyrase (YacG/DUF329 family)
MIPKPAQIASKSSIYRFCCERCSTQLGVDYLQEEVVCPTCGKVQLSSDELMSETPLPKSSFKKWMIFISIILIPFLIWNYGYSILQIATGISIGLFIRWFIVKFPAFSTGVFLRETFSNNWGNDENKRKR